MSEVHKTTSRSIVRIYLSFCRSFTHGERSLTNLAKNLAVFRTQYKLKQSQRAKVRQFMAITGTDDHTAINCLTQNDWRLDMATDNFFQDPLKYFVEPPRAPVDKKKIDTLFNKYRSKPSYCDSYLLRLHLFLLLLCRLGGGGQDAGRGSESIL